MRVVFMGTPEFAVPSLKMLTEEYNVVGVVTKPDKKRGRGKKISYTSVKKCALNNSLKVMQPKSVKTKEYLNRLKSLKPDVVITAAYGKILPQEVLDVPKYGTVNVHASILPKWRGAAPIHRALINGDKKTGITTMLTDAGMDTGDILLCEEIDVGENVTVGELHDKLAVLGAKVLKKTLKGLQDGSIQRKKQDDDEATYAPMVDKEAGRIDWNQPAKTVHNRIRGVTPWPGAYTFCEGKRLKLFKSTYTDKNTGKEPGEIININKECLEVATNPGTVKISEVQFENAKRMSIAQCGHNMNDNIVLKRHKED